MRHHLYRWRRAAEQRFRQAVRTLRYRLARDWTRNPSSARRLRRHPPLLSAVQRRLLAELKARGIAHCPFGELFDEPPWDEVAAEGTRFFDAESTRQRAHDLATSDELLKGKGYLIRLHGNDCRVSPEDPWLRLGLDHRILDLVNAYLGLFSKLAYFDLWYTVPSPPASAPQASQRWHRDPEDESLVKVFLYFSEVHHESGPLEYVVGSRRGERYHGVWQLPEAALLRLKGIAKDSYPPQDRIEREVPEEARVLATGAPGTLVFCDTSGLHRGGRSLDQPRLLAKWEYQSPASRWPKRYRLDAPLAAGWPAAARYAVN